METSVEMKDNLRSFMLKCDIGVVKEIKGLNNLGSSINFMLEVVF